MAEDAIVVKIPEVQEMDQEVAFMHPRTLEFSPEVEQMFRSLPPLKATDGFFLYQDWEAFELCTECWESNNEYHVYNLTKADAASKKREKGSIQFLEANEKTGCCARWFCGENRAFSFDLKDAESKQSMIKLARSYRCCGWAAIPCCAHQVNMYNMVNNEDSLKYGVPKVYGSGTIKNQVARVRAPWCGGCLHPTYYIEIYDITKKVFELKAKVSGNSCWYMPCIVCDCCGSHFKVVDSESGERIGSITKPAACTYKDLWLELNTEADKYKIVLDEGDMSLNMKMAILTSAFLIDFNFYEDSRGLMQCHFCDIFCCGYAFACCPLGFLWICPCCTSKGKKEKKQQKF